MRYVSTHTAALPRVFDAVRLLIEHKKTADQNVTIDTEVGEQRHLLNYQQSADTIASIYEIAIAIPSVAKRLRRGFVRHSPVVEAVSIETGANERAVLIRVRSDKASVDVAFVSSDAYMTYLAMTF